MPEQDFSGTGDLELLYHTAEGKLELGVMPVKGNTAQASWQSQPPAQELAGHPFEALHNGNWDYIDLQRLEESRQDSLLVNPGFEFSGEP